MTTTVVTVLAALSVHAPLGCSDTGALPPSVADVAPPLGGPDAAAHASTVDGASPRDDAGPPSLEPVAVVAGARHTCALLRMPSADAGPPAFVPMCWGASDVGQLGSAVAREDGFARVTLPSGVDAMSSLASSASGDTTCGVGSDGNVLCWGKNDAGQSGAPPTPSALAASVKTADSGFAAAALSVGGASACATVSTSVASIARCWGRNTSCELGTSAPPCSPDSSYEAVEGGELAAIQDASSLALGRSHGCALVGGRVLCWGANDVGQAEPGGPAVVAPPTERIAADATAVAAGDGVSCALTAGGRVQCWGDNRTGAIADGDRRTNLGVTDAFPGRFGSALQAGRGFVCAEVQGKLLCRGSGDRGQLGRGSLVASGPPAEVSGLTEVRAFALGGAHACAITGLDGARRLSCWGANDAGQVDPSSAAPRTDVLSPRRLNLPSAP